MNSVQMEPSRIGANGQTYPSRTVASVPGELENRVLRQGVRENLVSFPSQVPVFEKQSRPDLQQKLVVLYFVRGWTMDELAQRYRLGRQRMGQILTAWRIRAVREGYIQAIEPEHPLFKRVRLEQVSQFAEMPVRSSPVAPAPKTERVVSEPLPEIEEPRAPIASVTELRGSNLAEELHAIVSILDNQLQLRSKPLSGSLGACEQLLARARTLCARLESQAVDARSNGEWRTTAVISAAKELFDRFQQVKPASSVTHSRNVPPRASQRVAANV